MSLSIEPPAPEAVPIAKILVSEKGVSFLREEEDERERKIMERQRAIQLKRREEERKRQALQEQAAASSELKRFNTFKSGPSTKSIHLATMTRFNSERLSNMHDTIMSMRKEFEAGIIDHNKAGGSSRNSIVNMPASHQDSPLSSLRRVPNSKKNSFRLRAGEPGQHKRDHSNQGLEESQNSELKQLQKEMQQLKTSSLGFSNFVSKKLSKVSQVVEESAARQQTKDQFLRQMDKIEQIYRPLAGMNGNVGHPQRAHRTKLLTLELERQEKLLAQVAPALSKHQSLRKEFADIKQINRVANLNALENANLEKTRIVFGQIMQERVESNVAVGEIPEAVNRLDEDFRKVLLDNNKICFTRNREMARFSTGLKKVDLPTLIKPTGHVKGELSHRGGDSEAYSSKVLSSSEYQSSVSVLTHGKSFYGNPSNSDGHSSRDKFGSSARATNFANTAKSKFQQTARGWPRADGSTFKLSE